MSYIDSIEESIKAVDARIKELQKVKRGFKKEKQKYCLHKNIIRQAIMPRLSYAAAVDQYTAFDTVKVKTKCKDCGKIL